MQSNFLSLLNESPAKYVKIMDLNLVHPYPIIDILPVTNIYGSTYVVTLEDIDLKKIKCYIPNRYAANIQEENASLLVGLKLLFCGYEPTGIYSSPILKFEASSMLPSPMVNVGGSTNSVPPPSLGPGTPGPMTPMTPHSADPGIVPQLQNIVSTVNLNCKLDLKRIALSARNAEYNPKRFAAVIMRIREPRTTALIFSSGKMVCTGAKSEDDSRLAARKYARIIQKLGFTAKFLDFKIQNMVGSCDVKFPIRLEGLVLTHGSFSSYEPELFPGLIYRMVKPRIVLLIFVSGKVVLTGAKVRQEIYEAFDNIYPILKSFKKQ